MSVRVKRLPTNGGGDTTFTTDYTIAQRETTVDGQTFHWAPNQNRNFLDDGVGAAHAAFMGGATIVQENAIPFGTSRS